MKNSLFSNNNGEFFMCIPLCNTNDQCGIGRICNSAANVAVIGGITAVVAAFAAYYFEVTPFVLAALTTTSVLSGAAAIAGASFIAIFAYAALSAMMSR